MANKKQKVETSPLIQALNFISCAQKDIGAPQETHCRVTANDITATDGVLTAGYPVIAGFEGCPKTTTLLDALKICNEALIITQLENKLSIRSGSIKAQIKCLADNTWLPPVSPDPFMIETDDKLLSAIIGAGKLAVDKAATVVQASVWLRPRSCLGTNKTALLEYWHGYDLPAAGFVIPKIAIDAIERQPAAPVGIGFSESSLTFYYANLSWIKTQLFIEPWPVQAVELLDFPASVKHKIKPVHPEFFDAIRKLKKFSRDGKLRCDSCRIYTHANDIANIDYDLSLVNNGLAHEKIQILNIKDLLLLEEHVKFVDIKADNGHFYFYGEKARGLFSGTLVTKYDGNDIPF